MSRVRFCGREELPCIRGQGRQPGTYPTSEVRGSGQECQAATVQERPRGPTPHPRSGWRPRVPGCEGAGTAERSYPSQRSGAAAGRSYPTSKMRWLHRRRRA